MCSLLVSCSFYHCKLVKVCGKEKWRKSNWSSKSIPNVELQNGKKNVNCYKFVQVNAMAVILLAVSTQSRLFVSRKTRISCSHRMLYNAITITIVLPATFRLIVMLYCRRFTSAVPGNRQRLRSPKDTTLVVRESENNTARIYQLILIPYPLWKIFVQVFDVINVGTLSTNPHHHLSNL